MDKNIYFYQRYIALFSSSGKPQSAEQRLHLEMLNYLDDRRWLVKVWYHDRLPHAFRYHPTITNLYYTFRLLLIPAATLIIDYQLYPYLGWCLPLVRMLTDHRILLSLPTTYRQPHALGHAKLGWQGAWIRCLHSADLLMVDSKFTRRDLMHQGIDANKIQILHYGQNGLFAGRQKEVVAQRPLQILIVLSRQTQVWADFLNALSKMTGAWQLQVGILQDSLEDAGSKNVLTSWLKQHGGEQVITGLIPWQNEEKRQKALMQADVYVVPQLDEIQGQALVEALHYGLPIVAVYDEMISDLIQNQVTGLLTPIGLPRTLIKTLERLNDNRPLLAYLAAQSRMQARRFNPSWRKTRRRFGNLIEVLAR